MRHSFNFAALLWPSLCLSLTIPSLPSPPKQDVDEILTAVRLNTDTSVSIQFQARCNGCFVGTDDGLTFDLGLGIVAPACGESNLTLNNLELTQKWDRDRAAGHGTLDTKLANGLGHREIYASWQIHCIHDDVHPQDAGHLLTVKVHKIGKDGSFVAVKEPSGFTISYRPQGHPEIVRLSREPVEFLYDRDFVQGWLTPSATHAFTISNTKPVLGSDVSLEDEINQLGELRAYAYELESSIKSKERRVQELLGQDFDSFKSTLKSCDSLRCLFKAAWQRVPHVGHLLSPHLRHHPPSHSSLQKGLFVTFPYEVADGVESVNPFSQASQTNGVYDPNALPPPPPSDDSEEESRNHPPLDHDTKRPAHGEDGERLPLPPHRGHGPPPDDDGERPPFPPHRGHGPPPPGHDGEHGPPPDHGKPGGHHRPHLPHRGDHHHFIVHRVVKTVLVVFVLVAIFSFIFHLVHFRLRSSSARRADCAFNRESRQRVRAYRRAARNHKWSQWWSQYRRPKTNTDYDEKRALILGQETVLENAMQEELQGLRLAQEIVDEMSRAEQERARLYHEANFAPSTSSSSWEAASDRQSRGVGHASLSVDTTNRDVNSQRFGNSSRINSLPSYHFGIGVGQELPPPRYEEELEGDMTVVDGFQYTPSPTGSTAGSSVIDCSPRLSIDTGRTILRKEPGDDDSD